MNSPGPSQRLLFAIWVALLGLLFLTWGTARYELGPWNVVLSMSIAVAKILLVMLFFMQLRYRARLTWIFAAAGFFWLIILIVLTLADYVTRPGLLWP